ncbi:MAG: hypothetical protein J5I81_12475 [Nitrococcus mobilis]|nr:hypothetical protein [Nitrococcus mobilis]
MYLVDTSVWIDLFRQRDTSPARMLRALLDQRLPYGITGVIYQDDYLCLARIEPQLKLATRGFTP